MDDPPSPAELEFLTLMWNPRMRRERAKWVTETNERWLASERGQRAIENLETLRSKQRRRVYDEPKGCK